MKYRKRPVVIEAFQMTPEARSAPDTWPDWLKRAWQTGILDPTVVGAVSSYDGIGGGDLRIATLEDPHRCALGDWIIQGVRGELYPCKPWIFAETYEAVPEEPAKVLALPDTTEQPANQDAPATAEVPSP